MAQHKKKKISQFLKDAFIVCFCVTSCALLAKTSVDKYNIHKEQKVRDSNHAFIINKYDSTLINIDKAIASLDSLNASNGLENSYLRRMVYALNKTSLQLKLDQFITIKDSLSFEELQREYSRIDSENQKSKDLLAKVDSTFQLHLDGNIYSDSVYRAFIQENKITDYKTNLMPGESINVDYLSKLISDNAGIVIGEDHRWDYIKFFLAEHAAYLKDHGIDVVYTEFVHDIDTGVLHILLDSSDTYEEFENKLLNSFYGFGILKSNPENRQEIWAYHKAGIKVIGLETIQSSTITAKAHELYTSEQKIEIESFISRYVNERNLYWREVILSSPEYQQGKKFLIRCGLGHNGKTGYPILGIEDIINNDKIPVLTIFDMGETFLDNKQIILKNMPENTLDGYILVNAKNYPNPREIIIAGDAIAFPDTLYKMN